MMANRVRVKIEGGDELVSALRKMGVDVGQVLERAALAGGQVLARASNSLAPKPLIEAQTVKRSKTRAEVDVGPPAEKWYWRFRETGAVGHEITGAPLIFLGDEGWIVTGRVGHPGHAAQPFLRPAFDGSKGQATDAVGQALDRAIES